MCSEENFRILNIHQTLKLPLNPNVVASFSPFCLTAVAAVAAVTRAVAVVVVVVAVTAGL